MVATCASCGGPLTAQARVTYCKTCVRNTTPNTILRSLGLFGNKHIPTSYLRASSRSVVRCCRTPRHGRLRHPRGGINFDSTTSARQGCPRAVTESRVSGDAHYEARPFNGRDCGPSTASHSPPATTFRLSVARSAASRSSPTTPSALAFATSSTFTRPAARPLLTVVRRAICSSPVRRWSAPTMTANVLMSRCLALGARAFVIDRAGHYETLSRLVDGAQQIELGAEASPYALNPWDVPEPAKVPREKVAFLIALHQVMMGRLDGQQLGMLASGIRCGVRKGGGARQPADRVAAARGAPRPGRRRAPGRRAGDRRHAAEPGRSAVRVLRRGHLRLPARPPHDRSARQPAGHLRHPRPVRRASSSS